MERIVHSLADEEHKAFAPVDMRTFSVRLSYSTDQPDGHSEFDVFLEHAARLGTKGKGAVEVFVDRGGVTHPVPPEDIEVRFSKPGDPPYREAFKTWFKERVSALPDTSFSARSGTADQERSESELSAHDVLAGVTTWPAPAPHMLGLAFCVDVKGLQPEDLVIVVPMLGEATTKDIVARGDGSIDVGYNFGASAPSPYTLCRAGVSHPPEIVGGKSLVGEDGFVDKTFTNDDLARTVRRIEQRAGSLFTGYLAVGEISWPQTLTEPRASQGDEPTPAPFEQQKKFWLVCLAWRAAATLESSLDTILLALQMPGRHKFRDGPALEPFLDLLVRRGFLPDPDSIARSRRSLRRSVRSGLTALVESFRDLDHQDLERLFELCGLGEDKSFTRKLVSFAARPNEGAWEALKESATSIVSNSGRDKSAFGPLKDRLDAELATLNESVLGEKGAERVMLALLKAPEVAVAITGIGMVVSEYLAIVDEFATLLDQGINGAEAARQSVSSLIADLATHQLARAGHDSPDFLRYGIIERWEFWKTRLVVGTFSPDPVDPIETGMAHPENSLIRVVRSFEALWEHASLSFGHPELREILEHISSAGTEMGRRCIEELFPPEDARFLPDHAPQPLLAPIAIDPYIDDDDDIDSFSASFSGVAVLVRNASSLNWAYACLAEFGEPSARTSPMPRETPAFDRLPLAIAPLPTSIVDGRRELFVTYSGKPFSSAAYADAIAEADRDRGADPFYGLDHPALARRDKYDELPALAYGGRLDFAVHAVGRSGSLPRTLFAGRVASEPWLPPEVVASDAIRSVALTLPMSRRTAIGRVVFSDARGAPNGRLGLRPEGVSPLSVDYRRIAVSPGATTDVLRNGDGTGAIAMPKLGEPDSIVVLRGLRCWGDEGAVGVLTITVSARPNANAFSDGDDIVREFIDLKAGEPGDMAIAFRRTSDQKVEVSISDDGIGRDPQSLRIGDRSYCWLSLQIDGACSLSLSDPTLEWNGPSAFGRGESDNLLLLGAPFVSGNAKAVALWREPFERDAEIEVSLPRMSLQDFLRWMDNLDLRDEALELSDDSTDATRQTRLRRFDLFQHAMVALDIDRVSAPAAAERLDRLPDLAVSRVALTASPLDSLVLPPETMATADVRARYAQASIAMPTLWALLEDGDVVKNLELERPRIVKVLDRIDAILRHRLTITTTRAALARGAGAHFDSATVPRKLTIGGGLTARVSARPVVLAKRFHENVDAPVIDVRLLQFAVGSRAGEYVFDGAHIVVEAMIGPLTSPYGIPTDCLWLETRTGWAERRLEIVQHVPAGSSRDYRIALQPAPSDWRWRQVGDVTTWTQAWRFGGRPVHTWIDPYNYYLKDRGVAVPLGQASFDLGQKLDKDFFDFEFELFAGRGDLDALRETVKIAPLGQDTWLTKVSADGNKGATLYRHAFSLSSRYAGAMLRPETDGGCEAWLEEDDSASADRWMRIAMLCRRHGVLTRPQLRALVPLTRRAGGSPTQSFAPPVLAMLNEEPFAFGGLAARIASEIRTGIGYGQDPIDPAEVRASAEGNRPIAPQDFRKELGPDGRLLLVPMEKDFARRATLPPEGPIGLTFDRESSAAPLFANTALLLRPEFRPRSPEGNADDGVSEESFLSVGLRRYLDPNWLVRYGDDDEINVDGYEAPLEAEALWIEAPDVIEMTLVSPIEGPHREFMALAVEAGGVYVDRHIIDASVPFGSKMQLCGRPTETVCLLFAPREKGTFTLSVLAKPRQAEGGSGNAPVVLASVDCVLPDGLRPVFTAPAKRASVRRTSASEITALEWVRTNPDFDSVTVVSPARPGRRTRVDEIVALTRAEKGDGQEETRRLTFSHDGASAWIRSHHSMQRMPTNCQRHIVCLFAELMTGLGPEVERPLGAMLMPGASLTLLDQFGGADIVRLVEIETPSEIVGYPPDRTPEGCRLAHFDLIAIGAEITKNARRRFLFRIRHVGTAKAFPGAAASSLTLGLSIPGEKTKIEIVAKSLPPETTELLLEVDFDEMSFINWRLFALDEVGQIEKVNAAAAPIANPFAQKIDAMELTVVGMTVGKRQDSTETWFDIAMLTATADGFGHEGLFDFDLLFGARLPVQGRFDDPALVAGLHEAQARCVSVSPQIRMRSSDRDGRLQRVVEDVDFVG